MSSRLIYIDVKALNCLPCSTQAQAMAGVTSKCPCGNAYPENRETLSCKQIDYTCFGVKVCVRLDKNMCKIELKI